MSSDIRPGSRLRRVANNVATELRVINALEPLKAIKPSMAIGLASSVSPPPDILDSLMSKHNMNNNRREETMHRSTPMQNPNMEVMPRDALDNWMDKRAVNSWWS